MAVLWIHPVTVKILFQINWVRSSHKDYEVYAKYLYGSSWSENFTKSQNLNQCSEQQSQCAQISHQDYNIYNGYSLLLCWFSELLFCRATEGSHHKSNPWDVTKIWKVCRGSTLNTRLICFTLNLQDMRGAHCTYCSYHLLKLDALAIDSSFVMTF